MTPPSIANRSNSSCRNRGGVWLRLWCAYLLSGNGIAALRKLRPGNSALLSLPRTVRSRQPHLQMLFTGIKFECRGYHALQVPDNEEKCGWYRLDKNPGQSAYHQIQARASNSCGQSSLIRGQWSSVPYKRPAIPPSESETDSKNRSAESGIPITLGPTPLDDILNATRPNADDPLTDESSDELQCAIGTRGAKPSPHDTRGRIYAALPQRKTCQFRIHKWGPQASPTESCDLKIKGACAQRCHVLNSGRITDQCV